MKERNDEKQKEINKEMKGEKRKDRNKREEMAKKRKKCKKKKNKRKKEVLFAASELLYIRVHQSLSPPEADKTV